MIKADPTLKLTETDATLYVSGWLKLNASKIKKFQIERKKEPTLGGLRKPDIWNKKLLKAKTVKGKNWTSEWMFLDYKTYLYYVKFNGRILIESHKIEKRTEKK